MVDITKLKENKVKFQDIYGISHCIDGITDIDIFNKTEPKILWVLKEPNDTSLSWNQRDFHKDVSIYRDWKRTYKLIIKISYAIINKIYNWEDVPNEYDIRKILHNIALINIKKIGGNSSANDTIIRNYFYRDEDLLIEQIKVINPNIIINCSRVFDLFMKLNNSEIKYENDFQCGEHNKGIIINAYHPNARYKHTLYFSNIMDYINMYNII